MHTLYAMRHQGWRLVLLGPRMKKPATRHWVITSNIAVIEPHLHAGGNIGLICGEETGVAVFDFDDLAAMTEMFAALGPLAETVHTGSGKRHCYVRWEPDLPAKITWNDRTAGEVQRGASRDESRLQQVVMPPSIHPVTGEAYRWLVDPCQPVTLLPDEWRVYLKGDDVPEPIPIRDTTGIDDFWAGPAPDELLQRALQQPGAARRSSGAIKFQCPGCREVGRDRHRDNAIVFADGRWGCAVDAGHKVAIAAALGVETTASKDVVVEGYDTRLLRRLGIRL
jgi:hypothetical protein